MIIHKAFLLEWDLFNISADAEAGAEQTWLL